jgi:hypothetical protein
MRFARSSGQCGSPRYFFGMRLGDLFMNLFQVGKGIEFHTAMLPQSPSPSVGNERNCAKDATIFGSDQNRLKLAVAVTMLLCGGCTATP